MSASSVRATCPGCQHPLRIPRELLGQPVKCKKCGTVVRSKAPAEPVAAGYPPQGAYPYAPPPGYAYPQAAPNPLEIDHESDATSSYKGRGKYRRGQGNATALYLTIGFSVMLVLGITVFALYVVPNARKQSGTVAKVDPPRPAGPLPATNPTSTGTPAIVTNPSFGPMPRRMLFMQVNNYLYLNPLTSASPTGRGIGPDRTRAVAKRLAYDWRVNTEKENNQLYVLSDLGSLTESRAPYKNVLMETYQKFFETCRAQDRLLVYFGGHVAEVEGKVFLVPIEGDLEDAASLIPIEDFYAKLNASPAQQKVVVWDVCRYNPQRGRSRKGSEPMTEAIEKGLTAAIPPGVEVILTCGKDQNALEFFSHQMPGETPMMSVAGSSFLSASIYVADKNKNKARGVSPTDPYPVQEWLEALGKRIEDVSKSTPKDEGKALDQKPKLYGAPKSEQVAYNPNEAFPVRFEFPQPPKGASPDLVAAIRDEIKLPSLLLKGDDEDNGLASVPFAADKLEPFKTTVTLEQILGDKEKYKFEFAVHDSLRIIREVWEGKAEGVTKPTELRKMFPKSPSESDKKQIKEEQEYPALAMLALETVEETLMKLAPEREKAPKRWQANYDYALAQTKARLAFMAEYNTLLGATATLEATSPLQENHIGWMLASREKMKSKKAEVARRDEARELYAQIIEQYKGTPWEIQAKREKGIALGLEWQPYSEGGKLMD